MIERDTLRTNELGHLEIGGCDTVELADKFGTPLYVMDEAYIRNIIKSWFAMLRKRSRRKRFTKFAKKKKSARTWCRGANWQRRCLRAYLRA